MSHHALILRDAVKQAIEALRDGNMHDNQRALRILQDAVGATAQAPRDEEIDRLEWECSYAEQVIEDCEVNYEEAKSQLEMAAQSLNEWKAKLATYRERLNELQSDRVT